MEKLEFQTDLVYDEQDRVILEFTRGGRITASSLDYVIYKNNERIRLQKAARARAAAKKLKAKS